jgi:hypothetical protein
MLSILLPSVTAVQYSGLRKHPGEYTGGVLALVLPSTGTE